MTARARSMADVSRSVGPRLLPFADAATPQLPLLRLLRLSLFQVSVGLGLVLLNGTLNRVMIVELGIPAAVVGAMVALPILFAPARALIGYRSDNHRSALGWRRVPYIWMGTLIQFGGLAILPFALLVLSGRGAYRPPLAGELGVALAFLMIGAGLHTAQTAGVALATDLAPEHSRPRVVALLYVMLLLGMVVAALSFGALLEDFSYLQLVKIIQGAGVVTLVLNTVALWKQEPRRRRGSDEPEPPVKSFLESYRSFLKGGPASRLLVVVGLGCAGLNMQDVLLEPYGGEVLKLPVAATTALTALMASGTLAGLFFAARWLGKGANPYRLAARGAVIGAAGLVQVIISAPSGTLWLFLSGTACIGFGSGWFSVGTLTASMGLAENGLSGLAIGAWGAVQATVAGTGIAVGAIIRDVVGGLAMRGELGAPLTVGWLGYSVVYHLEVILLVATYVAIAPLVKAGAHAVSPARFGLAELPG